MADERIISEDHPIASEKEALSKKLDAIGFAVFLIWVGVASLLDFGWTWGPIGVAAVILGATAIRWRLNLKTEGFWIVVGLMFLIGGVWEMFNISWPLAPFLIIGCGLAILWGVLSGKNLVKK